jgi:PAS domain S-box-containing protein
MSSSNLSGKYISGISGIFKIHEIIKFTLETIAESPAINFASIFFLKEDTYEFEHKSTVPKNKVQSAEALYSELLNNGNIGITLEKGEISINNSGNNYIITLPLRMSWGIQGLLIVSSDGHSNELIDCLNCMSPIAAAKIEAAMLNANLKKTREVLEQKVAARTMELANNQRKFRAILDSVHTAIMIINSRDNRIEILNPVAAEMIGDKEENIIGREVSEYLKDKNEFESDFESMFRNAKGEKIPIIRTISHLNLGNEKYIIESFFDITEQKNAEKALKDSNELLELKVEERTLDLQLLVHKLKNEIEEREQAERELQKMLAREKELNELKTRFVTMVSHEFRTPLTVIRSSAQMIDRFMKDLTKDEKRDFLSRIIKTVDIMTDLIENVIFIGKTDRVTKSASPEKTALSEYSGNIIKDILLGMNKKRNVNFSAYGECDEVLMDKKLYRLILTNLVSNSIKYSADEKSIDIEIVCTAEQINLSVKDYGIGIPDDEQERIFDLFYRGKNVSSYSGTGLGMSVVMQSVNLLGGTIDISSKINMGTTFRISIPRTKGGE